MTTNWADEATRPEHIKVYMENFGPIPLKYHVHHIDYNHDNNDPNNLIAIPRAFHKNLHSNPGFYLSMVRTNLVDKQLLLEVLDYYKQKGYSNQKSFMVVFVEFCLAGRKKI